MDSNLAEIKVCNLPLCAAYRHAHTHTHLDTHRMLVSVIKANHKIYSDKSTWDTLM